MGRHNLTSTCKGFVNELSSRIEVDTHVKRGRVVSLDAVICDVHPSIVLCSSAPLALRAVEDVRDAQFGQFSAVRGYVSAESETLYGN